jgi:hypothetical protein
MVVLWSAFAGAALAYPDAFGGVEPAERVDSMAGLALFLYISVMNGMILLLIAVRHPSVKLKAVPSCFIGPSGFDLTDTIAPRCLIVRD